MLKIEPKEADLLPMPSMHVLRSARDRLAGLETRVGLALRDGNVTDAAKIVDEMILVRHLGMNRADVGALSDARAQLHARREARGARPRDHA
jgi:adenine-specific DNA-methyltransferase